MKPQCSHLPGSNCICSLSSSFKSLCGWTEIVDFDQTEAVSSMIVCVDNVLVYVSVYKVAEATGACLCV